MGDCPRIGKLFGGCKWSPRYDLGAPTVDLAEASGSVAGMVAIMETSKVKTYVRDVCERCGKAVERN